MSAVPGTTTPGSGWKICTEKGALLDTARLPDPVPVLSCYHEKPSLLQESRNLQTQPFFNLLDGMKCPALRYTYCLPAVRSREGEGNGKGKGEGEDGHSNHYFPAPVNLFLCCVYNSLPGVHISTVHILDAAALAGKKLMGKTYLYICSRTSRFIILPTLPAWSLFSGRDRRLALEMCIRVAAAELFYSYSSTG